MIWWSREEGPEGQMLEQEDDQMAKLQVSFAPQVFLSKSTDVHGLKSIQKCSSRILWVQMLHALGLDFCFGFKTLVPPFLVVAEIS